jgi:hypothetical protein
MVGPLGFEGGRVGDLGKFHRPNVCLSSAASFPFFDLPDANWLGDDKRESRSQMSSMRRQRHSYGRRTDSCKMFKVSWSWSHCLSSRCKVPSMRSNQGLERFQTSNVDRTNKTTLFMFRVRPSVYREISNFFSLFFNQSIWRLRS